MGKGKKQKDELTPLVVKRDSIIDQLNRFKQFFETFSPSQEPQLPDRIKKCEGLWDSYEDVQSKIEMMLDEEQDIDRQVDERKRFETLYFESLSLGKSLLNDNKSIGQSSSQCNDTPQFMPSQAKLPIIEIPKFSGAYDQWVPFYDIFSSLIHNSTSLTDIQKFYYLKGSLVGEAADILHSLQTTDSNYSVAWDLLKERFENKRLMTNHYLKILFDVQPLSKESSGQLRHFLDETKKVLRVLKVLKQPVEAWNTILIYMLSSKLDPNSKREWESSVINDSAPSIDSFFDFLAKRCQLLETLEQGKVSKTNSNVGSSSTNQTKYSSRFTKQALIVSNKKPFSCIFCKGTHLPFHCSQLLSLSVKDRISKVMKAKLCLNCLRPNHTAQDCRSGSCKKCNKKHSSILHIDDSNSNTDNQKSNTPTQLGAEEENSANQASVFASHSQAIASCNFSEVLLSTARVYILDSQGKQHECRCILDSGSQCNFMTKEICALLRLPKRRINMPVVGIAQAVTNISFMSESTILSRINSHKFKGSFLIVDKITENLPSFKVNSDVLNIPSDIVLADPTYHIPGKVDLLIGATLFWELLCVGQVRLSRDHPIMQKTKLGWVLSGTVPNKSIRSTVCNLAMGSIQQQLERFWKQEEPHHVKPIFTKEQETCERIFEETTFREGDGRFCVRLPVKDDAPKLGESFDMALKRFEGLERKLSSNPELKELYQEFLQEYESLGHMSRVEAQDDPNQLGTYYLPHHGIFKESSTTTKLRVVFDASAKSSNGISLNDQLLVGGKIQDDLFDILVRFRKYNFVIAADIEKMYRQIYIAKDQRPLQRILWRETIEDPIQIYQLNTVTYGTASAPFLAVRCLKQISIDIKNTHSDLSKVIQDDFYMDDLLSGSNNIENLTHLKVNLTRILQTYGFNLRKWLSNCPDLLQKDEQSDSNDLIIKDSVNKTLGVVWNSKSDTLQYNVKDVLKPGKVTKRSMLSVISQIYDPFGLLGPTIVKAKIILQKLWQINADWDESVPMDLHTSWTQFARQLPVLNRIEIPRKVIDGNFKQAELHCFCDASEQAYGACLYARSVNSKGKITVQLICAKSRVAPLKQISLPRLELCGAVLASQLTGRVIDALQISELPVTFWTDSTIVLSWLAAEPIQWKTFVANRVTEIQELTANYKWCHIRSQDNPADVISRGLNPSELLECSMWWNGPEFLHQELDQWPIQEKVPKSEVPEKRTIQSHYVRNLLYFFDVLFQKYSSLLRLQRVTAFCLRFIQNLRTERAFRKYSNLTIGELENALKLLLKACQEGEFPEEVRSLKKGTSVGKTSKLLPLSPFLDQSDILRVGGRLGQSHLDFDQKHPVILPKNHILTKLIILHYHYQYLHAGPQSLLAIIRLKYWPLSGRSTIRKILNKCIVCFRNKPRDLAQIMGDLPSDRITPTRPFSIVGTDFAGPFKIKTSKLRSYQITKAYMCVFVCFVTKAVHIELVSDLTTDSFLNCFKRFISRRGLCSTIYSDNGTSFVGAFNEIQAIYEFLNNPAHRSVLTDYLSKVNITWKFIPPRSPHFGGLWESAVKSAKYHIKRVVGDTILTFEELYTILTQVESCLNSRPLLPLTENPEDFQILTPGHFLIGSSLAALPQVDLTLDKLTRLNRYQMLTQMLQNFWSQWSREYLCSLQPRSKWQTGNLNLDVGTMVLVKDEQLPPNQWLLGRVIETFKGSDGKVRVANVKTPKGVIKRAIAKLSVLPIEKDQTQ